MAIQNNKLIKLDSLSYEIEGFKLINNISLDISIGNMVSIVGPNGSGKSTLIRLISGELLPTTGRVFFNDKQINEWDIVELSRNRSFLSQSNSLSFPFSVIDIVKMGLYPYSTSNNRKVYNNNFVNDLLEVFDLGDCTYRNYMTLSGGEKQRVQLARVLLQVCYGGNLDNKLLILDEPTSFLDVKYQSILFKYLKEINKKNLTIIMVLHDINHAILNSHKIMMIKDGELFSFSSAKASLNINLLNKLFDSDLKMVKNQDSLNILVY